MNSYDVTVIGSGPGGYVAAIRCAQLGMKTAIVERYASPGGTCLNVGCIPSKALLDSSEHFHNAAHRFEDHGILTGKLSVDLGKMMKRKDDVVKQNADGLRYLFKKNKIDLYQGWGSFSGNNLIDVQPESGEKIQLSTKNTIIATGSKPSGLPGITVDKKRIITSTEALQLTEIPKTLIVVGGGVIGLELGSVYARLGSKIIVVEFLDSLIATMDRSLGTELQKILGKLGFTFYLQHSVKKVSATSSGVSVQAEDSAKKKISIEGDYCLLSVGRRPFTDNLNLEKAGLKTDEKGRIPVNESLETSTKGIYAIGDVIRGAMLAHKAEEEGVFVAETIAGQKPHINYQLIPSVVYTWPEVAGTGATEQDLKSKNIKYKTGTFPFKASGRARASMDTDGFVKVYADAVSDELLGVHMIGPRAADLIGEAVTAMEFRAAAEDIARISHAHPTYSEALKEACLAATENRPIHI